MWAHEKHDFMGFLLLLELRNLITSLEKILLISHDQKPSTIFKKKALKTIGQTNMVFIGRHDLDT